MFIWFKQLDLLYAWLVNFTTPSPSFDKQKYLLEPDAEAAKEKRQISISALRHINVALQLVNCVAEGGAKQYPVSLTLERERQKELHEKRDNDFVSVFVAKF